ncbi:Protein of uncharacterised function (DUF2770) [Leminorella richardii]|uniref:Protein of uncharacterized function (DUF2770) n=1 Tax=Leminorella richardii TaxID=158841 RepID=A0A2X4V6S2_9GAMM|nr:DUF2770 family protein [Leminorella richardii]SQI40980.1 Protein of uncharacterised function (DUF2770) [Leminorella richardii]
MPSKNNKPSLLSRILNGVVQNVREHLMIYLVIWLIVMALDVYFIWFYE